MTRGDRGEDRTCRLGGAGGVVRLHALTGAAFLLQNGCMGITIRAIVMCAILGMGAAACREPSGNGTAARPEGGRADPAGVSVSAEPGGGAAGPASHESEAAQPDSVLTYEYVYPYNTEDLVENHYIELRMRGDSVTGRYYGTTDDFDSAREGYLPGFFVTTMNDLRIVDGAISFSLSPWDYFITPRTPGTEGVATDETRWKGPKVASSRSYRGSLTPDSLILYTASGTRPFARIAH